MAQINFPIATADGQIFEAPTGVLYTYVGTPPEGYWTGTFDNIGTDTLDGRYVRTNDNGVQQTIATAGLRINSGTGNTILLAGNGSASFSGEVVLPVEAPTTDATAANKKYVDDEVAAVAAGAGEWIDNSDDDSLYPKTASRDIKLGGTLPTNPNIKLHDTGAATFKGDVFAGAIQDIPGDGVGSYLSAANGVLVTTASGDHVFKGYVDGTAAPTSQIFSSGSASFAGSIQSRGNPLNGTAQGVILGDGYITVARGTGTNGIFAGYTVGNSTPTVSIKADGSATFAGRVGIGPEDPGSWNANFNGPMAVIGSTANTACGIVLASSASSRLDFSDGTGPFDQAPGSLTYDHSSNSLLISTDNARRAIIDSSGNLGIGGTIPSAPNTQLNADGSGVFAGSVTASSFVGDGSGITNFPTVPIPDGTTSQKGIVQLEDSVGSTSVTTAATPNAAKTAYDRGSEGVTNAASASAAATAAQGTANNATTTANSAVTNANNRVAKSGDTMSGNLTVNAQIQANYWYFGNLTELT